MQATIELFYEDDEKYFDYEVEFEFSAGYTPARINCRIEDSCPADGHSDWEVITVKQDGVEVEYSDLEKSIRDTINESVREWVDENGVEAIQDYNDECKAEAQYEARYEDRDDYF